MRDTSDTVGGVGCRLYARMACVVTCVLGAVSCGETSPPGRETNSAAQSRTPKYDRAVGIMSSIVQATQGARLNLLRINGLALSSEERLERVRNVTQEHMTTVSALMKECNSLPDGVLAEYQVTQEGAAAIAVINAELQNLTNTVKWLCPNMTIVRLSGDKSVSDRVPVGLLTDGSIRIEGTSMGILTVAAAQAMVDKAVASQIDGQYQQVIDLTTEVLKSFPELGAAYGLRSSAHALVGEWRAAQEDCVAAGRYSTVHQNSNLAR